MDANKTIRISTTEVFVPIKSSENGIIQKINVDEELENIRKLLKDLVDNLVDIKKLIEKIAQLEF